MADSITVDKKHVVYADEERVICWLWNFRDSKHTSIRETTKQAIFFLDAAFPMNHIKMQDAIVLFEEGLVNCGGSLVTHNGILSKNNMQVDIDLAVHIRTITGSQGLFDSLLFRNEKLKKTKLSAGDCKLPPAKQETTPRIQVPFVPASIVELATPNWAVFAASTGNLALLKSIVEHTPALLTCKDWSKSTLLMHAAIGNHDEVAAYLVDSAASTVDEKNEFGETACDLALKHQSQKVLDVLRTKSSK